jgi:phenylpyruvate tautomerase PptA (4-oxalocrotonate tautomerase family)
MPTYTVYSPKGQLTGEQRATIARGITGTHTAATGAQGFFAQVIFNEVETGTWFMGGKPLGTGQVYLCGHIRGGRPAAMKARLLEGLRDVLIEGAKVPRHSVWCYLVELPPSHMIEYGHVLPEPGSESQWLADMPAEDRERLEAIGK